MHPVCPPAIQSPRIVCNDDDIDDVINNASWMTEYKNIYKATLFDSLPFLFTPHLLYFISSRLLLQQQWLVITPWTFRLSTTLPSRRYQLPTIMDFVIVAALMFLASGKRLTLTKTAIHWLTCNLYHFISHEFWCRYARRWDLQALTAAATWYTQLLPTQQHNHISFSCVLLYIFPVVSHIYPPLYRSTKSCILCGVYTFCPILSFPWYSSSFLLSATTTY